MSSNSEQADVHAIIKGENINHFIENQQIIIGRKLTSSIQADIALETTKSVSRQHARISYNNHMHKYVLTVLGKNGVFVNEKFVKKGATVILENHSKIQIGEVILTFSMGKHKEPKKLNETHQPKNIIESENSTEINQEGELEEEVDELEEETENEEGGKEKKGKFDDKRPSISYAKIIAQAINSTQDKKITVNGIYNFVLTKYPYFQTAQQHSWQNSIRHNLSLNKAFIKIRRKDAEAGKGGYWTLDPNAEHLIEKEFRYIRKRAIDEQPELYNQPAMKNQLVLGVQPKRQKPNDSILSISNAINTSKIMDDIHRQPNTTNSLPLYPLSSSKKSN